MTLHYLTSPEGKKTAVVLPLGIYEKIQEALEELAELRKYDAAKKAQAAGETILSLAEVTRKLKLKK